MQKCKRQNCKLFMKNNRGFFVHKINFPHFVFISLNSDLIWFNWFQTQLKIVLFVNLCKSEIRIWCTEFEILSIYSKKYALNVMKLNVPPNLISIHSFICLFQTWYTVT